MAIQLKTFAERVLFGTSLEEKLSFPTEEIVDTHPGDPVKTPATLPRPDHLKVRDDDKRVAAPSSSKLIDEKERGRLLHFFGNHELLATELMALALLKFPNAPASFRQGVLETLKEEQIHTQLYIHRMEKCGVEFGELPLSDYFWKSVSSMEDPLDYVTRLSLTFEQANLDYSREYAKLFQSAGDESTANILNKIYKDEIEHVGFGLRWFRKWKRAEQTDWDQFRERLVFPLSPARAKGPVFNREGRIEAGLEESFINDLQIYQRSRGRTPTVFWFNSDAEKYAASNACGSFGESVTPAQRDLEFLPAYLSRRDDLVIVKKRPSNPFLAGLQQKGIHLPEIIESDRNGKAPVITRKLGGIRPWAWTPDSLSFFSDSFGSLTREVNTDSLWNNEIWNLFSKAWGTDWGSSFEEDNYLEGWNATESVYGKLATSLDEVTALRKALVSGGYENVVCKAPFGTAAGGNRCIMADEEIGPVFCKWLETVLREQGHVVVEPWLDRIYDFSVQFDMGDEGLKLRAFTRLINNPRGQFRGIITNGFVKDTDQGLTRFLMERSDGRPQVYSWYEDCLAPRLENSLLELGYRGPLGMDAFVYRDNNGEYRLKSVVEINPRFTMGRVAHDLGRLGVAGAPGLFQIVSSKQVRKSTGLSLSEFAEELEKSCPVQLAHKGKPQISEGSFALTDPSHAERFLALFHVRQSMAEIRELLNQF